MFGVKQNTTVDGNLNIYKHHWRICESVRLLHVIIKIDFVLPTLLKCVICDNKILCRTFFFLCQVRTYRNLVNLTY